MTPQEWTALKIRALDLAEVIDAHRIFPKFFVFGYGVFCLHIGNWFMGLPVRDVTETTFVTIIVSVFAPLVSWYTQGGRKWA